MTYINNGTTIKQEPCTSDVHGCTSFQSPEETSRMKKISEQKKSNELISKYENQDQN